MTGRALTAALVGFSLSTLACSDGAGLGGIAPGHREVEDGHAADAEDSAPDAEDAVDAPEVVVASPLAVSPNLLDFGGVQAQATETMIAQVLNVGMTPVVIDRFRLLGHLGYRATIAGFTYAITAESVANGVPLVPPLTLEPGQSTPIGVSYTATGPEAAQGSIVLYSSAPGVPEAGVELRFFANSNGPCVTVNPSRVSFGGRLVGEAARFEVEVLSCGDVDLELAGVELIDDGGGVFALAEGAPTTFPLIVPAFSSIRVPVVYTPSSIAELGDDGQYPLDRGTLRIRSNAYVPELDVPLDGFGIDGSSDVCPVARITVLEGEQVPPQTVLHLSGLASTATRGTISAYEWSVVQPAGSVSMFSPSPYVAEPTFEVNVVGTYVFRLSVRDALGTASCTAVEYTVVVTPDDAIHIELLWDTPGDLNQADTGGDQIYFSVGTDVDLHLLHPKAEGKYFDWTYDCYWDNVAPEWGIFSPADNPRLDRDDTDGAGPENLNVTAPEQDVRYQVGVHYWNDWGYGTSFATVRIFINGVLRDEWSGVRMVSDDMWDSHYIDWPSGNVMRIGGGPQITPNFRGF